MSFRDYGLDPNNQDEVKLFVARLAKDNTQTILEDDRVV